MLAEVCFGDFTASVTLDGAFPKELQRSPGGAQAERLFPRSTLCFQILACVCLVRAPHQFSTPGLLLYAKGVSNHNLIVHSL